jgi:hypothetical protein
VNEHDRVTFTLIVQVGFNPGRLNALANFG